MSGIAKLKIIAYKNASDKTKQKTYEVLINPESFESKDRVTYTKKQGKGTVGPQLRFQHIPTKEISLKLIFDGTGLINNAKKKVAQKSVIAQIQEFKETTIQYQGKIHEPFYVWLSWGPFTFRGYLTSLNITYKLFKADGTPIRAEGTAVFNSSVKPKKARKRSNPNSPDLTHIRKIKAGDRLPNMVDSVYDGTNYYIQVAKFNKLNHLRRLKPGGELSFPPLES